MFTTSFRTSKNDVKCFSQETYMSIVPTSNTFAEFSRVGVITKANYSFEQILTRKRN